ncbi:MAG TPA: cupin domain-containing protein [Clostridiales bacterium]|nr:cupin domain-containing protein [Clostridiales bacterium]
MAEVFNEKTVSFELKESLISDYSWYTSPKIMRLVKSEHLQFDIRSLESDKFSYPYHFHRNSEEIFVILSGSVTLRTPEGFKQLDEGDIVFFKMGPEGAHQLYNHTKKPCRYLDIRTVIGLDVCEYPDSGKINILPYQEIYQSINKVDYYIDEDKVREKWPKEILSKING